MRLFIAPNVGGVPDAVITGEYQATAVDGNRGAYFLVMAWEMDVAPSGTWDVGDPSDGYTMTTPLGVPQTRAVESQFGVARDTFRGWSAADIMDWFFSANRDVMFEQVTGPGSKRQVTITQGVRGRTIYARVNGL